mgnify:CR=1 FL=1
MVSNKLTEHNQFLFLFLPAGNPVAVLLQQSHTEPSSNSEDENFADRFEIKSLNEVVHNQEPVHVEGQQSDLCIFKGRVSKHVLIKKWRRGGREGGGKREGRYHGC